jgi:hypothetical protein
VRGSVGSLRVEGGTKQSQILKVPPERFFVPLVSYLGQRSTVSLEILWIRVKWEDDLFLFEKFSGDFKNFMFNFLFPGFGVRTSLQLEFWQNATDIQFLESASSADALVLVILIMFSILFYFILFFKLFKACH